MINSRTKSIAGVSCLLFAAAACKARPGGSELRADQSADAVQQAFDPEDLAILLPVDGQTLKRPFASLKDLTTVLDGSALVPLSKVMSLAFYKSQVLPGIVQAAGNEPNPFAADEAKKALNDDVDSQWRSWYVTAVRFVPCGLPELPVPTAWTREVTAEAAHAGCRPRIRLSVQKFGVADCPVTCLIQDGPDRGLQQHFGTSDDKALHLVLTFAGPATDSSWKKLATADAAARKALATLKQQNALTKVKAQEAIRAAYEPAKDATKALTKAFLTRVGSLRDAAASGPLRLAYGAGSALPRIKAYVVGAMADETVVEAVTQALVVTDRARVNGQPDARYPGPMPGFAQKWFFAKYAAAKQDPTKRRYLQTPNAAAGTLLKRVPLDFAFETTSQGVGRVTAGQIEVFDDAPGSLLAMDQELKDSLLALPQPERDPAFLSTGFQDYGFLRKVSGDLELENAQFLSGRVGEADIAAATRDGYQRVVDANQHDVGDPSCVSCHVVTGVAARRDREVRTGQPAERAIGRVAKAVTGKNYSVDPADIGPGSSGGDLVQARPLGETWVVRAFGYYGWTPVISDRVVTEVEADVAFANEASKSL